VGAPDQYTEHTPLVGTDAVHVGAVEIFADDNDLAVGAQVALRPHAQADRESAQRRSVGACQAELVRGQTANGLETTYSANGVHIRSILT